MVWVGKDLKDCLVPVLAASSEAILPRLGLGSQGMMRDSLPHRTFSEQEKAGGIADPQEEKQGRKCWNPCLDVKPLGCSLQPQSGVILAEVSDWKLSVALKLSWAHLSQSLMTKLSCWRFIFPFKEHRNPTALSSLFQQPLESPQNLGEFHFFPLKIPPAPFLITPQGSQLLFKPTQPSCE